MRPWGDSPLKTFDFGGDAPRVSVRVSEGDAVATLFSKVGMEISLTFADGSERTLLWPEGERLLVQWTEGRAASVHSRILLTQLPIRERNAIEKAVLDYGARGLPVKTIIVGRLFGIHGRVIDNRAVLVVIDEEPLSPEAASSRQAYFLANYGLRTTLIDAVASSGWTRFKLSGEGVPSWAQNIAGLRAVPRGSGFIGVSNRGAPHQYRGTIAITAGRDGRLATVNQLEVEDLLRGLVPAEIFPSAPVEALKAQAVTARSEVLSKLGLRHFADPYLLCSDQHCAVYRGVDGEAASTNAAIDATTGEALFDSAGRLVDSVYSAVCGGHTENNEVVWGTPANDSLRGQPDLLPGFANAPTPDNLKAFLAARTPFACAGGPWSSASKFRWARTFTADAFDRLLSDFGVGHVLAMKTTQRGVSGRVTVLQVSGTSGATVLRGELVIRRTLGNLNSSLFELTAKRDGVGNLLGWHFRGGGWGHGVGLCQLGAIGRARSGQDYRAIVSHYFHGSQAVRLYESAHPSARPARE